MSSKITSVRVYFVEIPLRFKVEHALAARRANTTGFLVLTDAEGRHGIGEFLGRDYVMGETAEDIVACLRQLAPALVGMVISDPVECIHSLHTRAGEAKGNLGAIGALDLALLDLWGKQHNVPAASILTGNPLDHRTFSYSAVYPFASGAKLALLNAVYAHLMRPTAVKVKGTGDLEHDLRYVLQIRRAFDAAIPLRIDLNAGLAPDRAEAYITRMGEHGVTWFEQPFARTEWAAAARIQQRFGDHAILCADESVCTLPDLECAIAARAFRAVNIRIGKNGGLVTALDLYRRAVAAGMQVQLGALVGETSVLAYAGLHFAAATEPLAHYEGCFGNYLIKWDVIQPSLTISRGGRVSTAQLPAAGLVPVFDLRRLEQRALSCEEIGTER